MPEAIMVAVITAVGAVAGQWIIASASKRKDAIAEAKWEQKLNDRLDAIEHKLDIHNGYAEKLGEITTDIAVIKTEIKGLGGKR